MHADSQDIRLSYKESFCILRSYFPYAIISSRKVGILFNRTSFPDISCLALFDAESTNQRENMLDTSAKRPLSFRQETLHGLRMLVICWQLFLVPFCIADGPCTAPTLALNGTRIVHVSNEVALQQAISNAQTGDTIVLADGNYQLTNSLYLNGKNNITIRGNSGCNGAVLIGKGMDNPSFGSVPHGIWSNSLNTTIAHLTIRDTYDNTVVFNSGAQSPRLYSVKLVNSGSQFVKSNPTNGPAGIGVDNGIIEFSWFEYTAGPPATDHGAGVGYFNGISAHASDNWIIRGNLFKNLHNPDTSDYPWNPAVLMWNHSTNTLTENNVFLNVDRAISYGLVDQATGTDHSGGIIRNNFITNVPGLMSPGRTASSDGLIIVYDSPNTKVYHNSILSNGNNRYSIEFRFPTTTGGEARNNLGDASLNLRDGATATQNGNALNITASVFTNPGIGDLHVRASAAMVIDQAPSLPAVNGDIDGNPRPQGAGYEIGADEYLPLPPGAPRNLRTQ